MEEDKTAGLVDIEYNITPEPLPFVERNGFAHWAMAFGWIAIAFIGFNIVGGIVGVVLAFVTAPDPTDVEAIMASLMENLDVLFWANTSGQVLVMALGTFVIVRLSAIKGKRFQFLRLQTSKNVWTVSLVSVLLVVSVYPFVTFLGWLNSFVPSPEFLQELQQSMMELITKFLKSENALILGLLHIGLVPAVCEEIMYRGYVQRSLEKSWGIWAAIFVSGFVFGAYHLQITNILPLSALGILFAYVTYISNSIIPAMIAHLVNNGGQVIASSIYPQMLDAEVTPDTELPWLLIFASVIVSAGLIYLLEQIKLKPEHEPV